MRAAQILGLEQLLHRYPRQLSGGQRQRVAMGRAIVRNPQVFLFDEPLSNLDAKLRVQMRSEIKALHQRLKVTTVYVTHDQIEAMTMADKIVVMNNGIVEQAGPPLELYDRPANLFVAGFIGSPAMNMIEGDDRQRVTALCGRHAIGRCRPTATATMPARPSTASGPSTCGSTPTASRRSVQVVEPTGSETQVLLRVGDQSLVAAFRERVSAQPGEILRRSAPTARFIHLFDREIGPAHQLATQATSGGNQNGECIITRRDALRLTAGGAAALAPCRPGRRPGSARRRVAAPKLRPRSGASLRILRPARFVEPDEVIFRANTAKFQQATGIETRVDFVGWEDIRQQTAVAANTGTGPDIVLGWQRGPAHLRRQAGRADGRRRVPRQALRRLELPRREVRQEGTAPTPGSAFPSAAPPVRWSFAARP